MATLHYVRQQQNKHNNNTKWRHMATVALHTCVSAATDSESYARSAQSATFSLTVL
jgi:hypothetical protein